MRTLTWWLAASLLLAAVGCSGGGKSPAMPNLPPVDGTLPQVAQTAGGSLGTPFINGDLSASALAIYTIDVDPVSLEATSRLKETRQGQANDDLYLLSIDSFLRADSFRVRALAATATTIDVTYTVEHPFPAPNNPTGTPNGSTNRADLGVAGMVMVLADAPASGNTYFTDRIANTALVANADAYFSPGGLLTVSGTANTFPYRQLVDETLDPRVSPWVPLGVSNGGDVTGNFGSDGWTRAEFGTGNIGWTGYGVMHQGQVVANMLSLNKSALGSGASLDVAIVAVYNDPRGGATPAQKKANRLPPASPDASLFAYRMPHGALDVASIEFLGASGPFTPNAISAVDMNFRVTDWDARATETAEADLANDASFTNVAQGEAGVPALSVCIPGVLGNASFTDDWDPGTTVQDDDSAFGGDAAQDSGVAGDGIYYTKSVTKAAGSGQVAGDYTGMVRASDVQSGLWVGLDANLTPLTTTPLPVTYQAFTVTMGLTCTPPSGGVVSPSGSIGCTGQNANFSIAYTGDPAVTYGWDFGGGTTPNSSSSATPSVTLGAAGTYNGSVTIDNGCGTPVNFPFSYTVTGTWSEHFPDTTSSIDGRGGYYNSAGLIGGNPAFVHVVTQATAGLPISVRMVRATTPNPTATTDWTNHEITNFPAEVAGSTDTGIELLNAGGRPVVIYKDDTLNRLMCVVANNTNPTSSADWPVPHQIDAVTTAHLTFGATMHNGVPVVSFRDAGAAASIRIAVANTGTPSATANWNSYVLEDNANSLGFWSDIHSFDDGVSPRLAVVFRDSTGVDVKFARATTLTPASAADWTIPFAINAAASDGSNASITQYTSGSGPRLAVACYNQSATPVIGVNLYLANVAAPNAPADFNAPISFATTTNGAMGTVQYADIDIKNHNGRLAIAFTNPLDTGASCASFGSMPTSDFRLAYATTNTPTSAADFQVAIVDDANVATGFPCGAPPIFLGTSCSILIKSPTEIGLVARDGKNWIGLPELASRYYSRICPLP